MQHEVYDCFAYFNENSLFELRLETFKGKLDFFVSGESVKCRDINLGGKKLFGINKG